MLRAAWFLRLALGLAVVARAAIGHAAPTAAGGDEIAAPPTPRRLHALLRLDLLYAGHGGRDFNGTTTLALKDSLLDVPKLSPGVGYALGAGLLVSEVLPHFGLSVLLGYGQTVHASKTVSAGGTMPHPDARLSRLELELELRHENRFLQPFVGVSSGLVWLALPGTRTDVDLTQQLATRGLDASLRGLTLRPKAGVQLELLPGTLAHFEFGYGFSVYQSSSIASLSPHGLTARGVQLGLGLSLVWPS